MGVSLLDGLETGAVDAEAPDDGSLLRVLRFEVVDVYGLCSKLGSEGIQELAAVGEGSSESGPRVAVDRGDTRSGVGSPVPD